MADDEKLRDMAEHRGLKLVKSRKRKPGVGDYGKFGLTDAGGKPLLGIGDDGLTASAGDIEAYLRAGATSTWKASADATPANPPTTASVKADEEEAESAIKSRSKRTRDKKIAELAPLIDKPRPKLPRPEPQPEPELGFRSAKSSDGAALVPLFRQLAHVTIDELAIARNLDAASKAKGGMAVAERRGLVGCCGWAIIPTVQHGPVGRLTVLLVDDKHRRRGIATKLLDLATAALRNAGCTRIEAMSDIEIANAHGFFRALGFEQTSYRFARSIDGPE